MIKIVGFKSWLRSIILLGLAVALQGCAMSQLSGFGSGWFGGSSSSSTASVDPKLSEERLLAAAKSDTEGSADVPTTATGCPKFVVWPRDRNTTKYVAGREGDGLAIQYRGEITKSARECQVAAGMVTVKFGFAGRVLLGPKGVPGQIKLPVLVYITDPNRDKIKTERINVTVDVPAERPIGYFSYVRRVSFKIPPGALPNSYKLFVAFERKQS